MRAYAWLALASIALACGGSAFSSEQDSGGEGGAGDDGGMAGVLGLAGRGNGGSVVGNGGKLGTAGSVGTGGSVSGVGGLGIAGDLVAGGSFPIGGQPGVSGSGPGPDPIDEACPEALPDGSRGCAAGLTCSYGSDVRADCRTRAKCDQGEWAVYEVDCPVLKACPNIVQGNQCDADLADPCLIEGYIYCLCTGCGAGGPCSSETVWKCSAGSGPQGCPHLIPNEGQPCASDLTCPYGSCVTEGPVTAACNGATWGWQTQQCPQ